MGTNMDIDREKYVGNIEDVEVIQYAHALEYNQNHDRLGRFATSPGGSDGSDKRSGAGNKPAGAPGTTAGGDRRDVRRTSGGVESSGATTAGGEQSRPKPDWPAVNTEPLKGLEPQSLEVPGYGTVTPAPFIPARQAAAEYMRRAGMPYTPLVTYQKVDKARAEKIAAEYDKMSHDPHDPAVAAAYDAMIKETLAQYQVIKETGLKVDFIEPGKDPYPDSPRQMTEDVRRNNHMSVFPTSDGFGSSDADVSNNPLLADSGETFGGKPACVNDIFRCVHDYFGHVKEGNGFRADGEENAWRSHSVMYSELARRAMTSETRGQNSWLNFGPYGEKNRKAKTADTVFADQKTGIMSDWVMQEGAGDPIKEATFEQMYGRFREAMNNAVLKKWLDD